MSRRRQDHGFTIAGVDDTGSSENMRMLKVPRALCMLLPVLLACALPWTVCARPGDAHAMRMDMETEPALGVGAAFDARGRLWLARVQGGHVLVSRSDDLGKTFGKPVMVNPVAEKIYASGESRPEIAVGPQGQIYVTWTAQPNPQWTGYIRLARSTDGGQHFSAPIMLNRDPAAVTRGFDSLVVAGNGDLVVAWIDAGERVKAKAAGADYRGFALDYAWSGDAGQTFTAPREVAAHTCECCRTTIAREPGGNAALLFRMNYPGDIRDHAFAVLRTDGKAVVPARATFSGWRVAACPDQGPGLAIGSNGTLHGVWYEASHGPAIWYGQLDPGHPPRHTLKLGGPGAGHADVAVQGRDVWVAWNQVSAKGYQLMLRASHDDGATFGAPRALAESAAAVYSPQLLVHDAHAYVAWNTGDGFRLIAIGNAAEAKP